MMASSYTRRAMGVPLITGGAAPVALSYDPHWCGQEVCGPPPGAAVVKPAAPPAPAPVHVVALHFARTTPVTPPPPVMYVPPAVVQVPPSTGGDMAPPPAPAPSGGGGGGGAAPAPCSCSWWPAILFAAAGFVAVYVAQNKPKKRNPRRRR